ncbi:WD40 repeat domain-containing protein [uncultured Muribaculum sp.]|uniref:WD40 repeat domain-containing protein n=1 Tax=uncultured Muribaculum sp. TaxID=1918613 RepID=UPI0025DF4148|nr:WD40 repeat domain-containing protein [uncultured Muribaculum sp.]
MNQWFKTVAIAIMATATLTYGAHAEKKAEAKKAYNPIPKKEYSFKLGFNPTELMTYSSAFYPVDSRQMTTLRGEKLFEAGKNDTIADIAMSPAGNTFITIYNTKGKSVAEVWTINSKGPNKKFRFNNKKLGNPTAGAYYPDARNIYIATTTGIHQIEPREFSETGLFDIPFEVSSMTISPNGYFLAVSGGNKVAIYNLDDKKLRKEWDFGTKVNDMVFNTESSRFAVLTDDGVASIYDTRTMLIKKSIDDLGKGISCDYNFDGKYLAVVVDPTQIVLINLLDGKRETYDIIDGSVSDLHFIPDSRRNVLMAYNSGNTANARRMAHLAPYYGKLIAEQVAERMNEWMKMLPGETLEQYQARVNEQSRAAQTRLFESEISTQMAGDRLSMAEVSLGKYNRTNGMLQLDFSSMPSILLPVPESEIGAFTDADGLSFSDVRYGVLSDDNFEIIYAKVLNKANGQTYVYDNIERMPLSFMDGDDNVVSLEIIQQQMMEEKKLQEIRQDVVERSKQQNVISDHTNITVDSRVVPDVNADGERILNYLVKFTYEVDPEFSADEDFLPGKYHVEQSGAASSMLTIVKEAFRGDFAQYLKDGKKVRINISGTADSSPIIHGITYDGSFGEIVDVPVWMNGSLSSITITDKAMQNEQLALLRALGVKKYLSDNVDDFAKMNTDYRYEVNVAHDKGGQYRRITTEFTFIDAF